MNRYRNLRFHCLPMILAADCTVLQRCSRSVQCGRASEMFRVSGVDTLQACMRRQVSGRSVRHITCPKQRMKQKFIRLCYNLYTYTNLYTIYIHSLFTANA